MPFLFYYSLAFSLLFAGFVLEETVAVSKHDHDSVEVLPVPIKRRGDHRNEKVTLA